MVLNPATSDWFLQKPIGIQPGCDRSSDDDENELSETLRNHREMLREMKKKHRVSAKMLRRVRKRDLYRHQIQQQTHHAFLTDNLTSCSESFYSESLYSALDQLSVGTPNLSVLIPETPSKKQGSAASLSPSFSPSFSSGFSPSFSSALPNAIEETTEKTYAWKKESDIRTEGEYDDEDFARLFHRDRQPHQRKPWHAPIVLNSVSEQSEIDEDDGAFFDSHEVEVEDESDFFDKFIGVVPTPIKSESDDSRRKDTKMPEIENHEELMNGPIGDFDQDPMSISTFLKEEGNQDWGKGSDKVDDDVVVNNDTEVPSPIKNKFKEIEDMFDDFMQAITEPEDGTGYDENDLNRTEDYIFPSPQKSQNDPSTYTCDDSTPKGRYKGDHNMEAVVSDDEEDFKSTEESFDNENAGSAATAEKEAEEAAAVAKALAEAEKLAAKAKAEEEWKRREREAKAEAEAKRKVEEERKRIETEAKKKAEEERKRKEAEDKAKAEARKKAKEEAAAAVAAAKEKAEELAAAAITAAKKKSEEEADAVATAKAKDEEEARKKAEEEVAAAVAVAKAKAEEEAKKIAKEEAVADVAAAIAAAKKKTEEEAAAAITAAKKKAVEVAAAGVAAAVAAATAKAKAAEEARKNAVEEAAAAIAAAKKKAEDVAVAAKAKAEKEARRKAKEEAAADVAAAIAAAKKKTEEEARKKAEEEAAAVVAAEKKRAEEEAAAAAAAVAAKKIAEEEAAAAVAAAKKRADEEAVTIAAAKAKAEKEARRKAKEEAAADVAAAIAAAKKKTEEEVRKKAEEETAAIKKAEEEAVAKAKTEAEGKKKAEGERKRRETEAKKKAEEERKRKEADDKAKAEARKRAEEEAATAVEAAKKKAEEEARQKAEALAAAAAAKKKAEKAAAAMKKAEEEAIAKAKAEAKAKKNAEKKAKKAEEEASAKAKAEAEVETKKKSEEKVKKKAKEETSVSTISDSSIQSSNKQPDDPDKSFVSIATPPPIPKRKSALKDNIGTSPSKPPRNNQSSTPKTSDSAKLLFPKTSERMSEGSPSWQFRARCRTERSPHRVETSRIPLFHDRGEGVSSTGDNTVNWLTSPTRSRNSAASRRLHNGNGSISSPPGSTNSRKKENKRSPVRSETTQSTMVTYASPNRSMVASVRSPLRGLYSLASPPRAPAVSLYSRMPQSARSRLRRMQKKYIHDDCDGNAHDDLSVDTVRICSHKFSYKIHPKLGPCDRCWALASEEEREIFHAKGSHIRITKTRSGCRRSCAIFPSEGADGIPVRLCRPCFFATHQQVDRFSQLQVYKGNYVKVRPPR